MRPLLSLLRTPTWTAARVCAQNQEAAKSDRNLDKSLERLNAYGRMMSDYSQAARTSCSGQGQGYWGAFLGSGIRRRMQSTWHVRNSPIIHGKCSSPHFPGYEAVAV